MPLNLILLCEGLCASVYACNVRIKYQPFHTKYRRRRRHGMDPKKINRIKEKKKKKKYIYVWWKIV